MDKRIVYVQPPLFMAILSSLEFEQRGHISVLLVHTEFRDTRIN